MQAIARAGLCSRREAERWIAEGRVSVNGRTLRTPGVQVSPRDRIEVDGSPLPQAEPVRLWRYHKPRGLVTTHRDPEGRPTVFENQSVFDNLLMALKKSRSPFDVMAYRRNAMDTGKVEALAAEIGLSDQLQRTSGQLSHGQKQWLEIGMLLAQEPQLLLVDEPAAGMTPQEREHTTNILRRAAETRAVVVVEHDMEFVRRLDCRVTVLHEGSVLSEGSIDHVTQHEAVIEVYLGR